MFFNQKIFLFNFYLICFAALISTHAWSVDKLPEKLIKQLQKGGFVVYMRHAQTDHAQVDNINLDLSKCDTQRNLSDQGRKQAALIGDALRALNVPIGNVLSSPYCRCKETATLVFGRKYIHENLYFTAGMSKSKRETNSKELLKLLSVKPKENTNTVIVSHSSNLKEATGIWPKPEAVMHVFKPNATGYEYMGGIHPDSWLGIAPKKHSLLIKQ